MNNLDFKFWSPTEAQAPKHYREDNSVLVLHCDGAPYCYGKWIAKTTIKTGATYVATVECRIESCPTHEDNHAYAMINWRDENGKYIQREHLMSSNLPENHHEWLTLTCTSEAPEGATEAELELTLSAPGKVKWRNATIIETTKAPTRPVKIASAFFTPRYDLQQNLETMLTLADQAGKQKADILLFTESAYDRGITPIQAKCIPVPSASPDDPLGRLGTKAKEHNLNILVNIVECENGFFFNSTVLLDRNGQYKGKYHKSHLPPVEKEAGFSPGNTLPILETDFATIGIMTCFDLAFIDIGHTLREKGAEIIFVPTIGNFMLYSQILAKEAGRYIVVSGGDKPHPSRIINPNGDIIASVDGTADGIAFTEIDLSKSFYSMALGFYPAKSNAHNALHNQRRQHLYT